MSSVTSVLKAVPETAHDPVDAERLHMARELHDIVAYSFATINVQAAGGGPRRRRPPRAGRGGPSRQQGDQRPSVARAPLSAGLRCPKGVLRAPPSVVGCAATLRGTTGAVAGPASYAQGTSGKRRRRADDKPAVIGEA